VKTSLRSFLLVILIRPETKWANYEQVKIIDKKIIEDWTQICGKILRRLVIRGERLIKFGDSWFSTKFI